MNDRGKPLSPVDMLKAYLLGSSRAPEDRNQANAAWKKTILSLVSWEQAPDAEREANFVKSWLRARYAESVSPRAGITKDRDWDMIGTTFHGWVRDNAQRL